MPSFPQHRNQKSSTLNQNLPTRSSSSLNEANLNMNDNRKRQNLPPLRVGCTNIKRIRKS